MCSSVVHSSFTKVYSVRKVEHLAKDVSSKRQTADKEKYNFYENKNKVFIFNLKADIHGKYSVKHSFRY
jgi:hypothetical protein